MSFWGKLGKGLLKVGKVAAPIAAGMVGGPGAAMAVSGGMSALDKKLSGGSWKDALGSAAIGAGTAYAGAKIPGADKVLGKGISPSKGFNLGSLAKQTGRSMLGNNIMPGESGGMPTPTDGGTGWTGLLKTGLDAWNSRRKQPNTGKAVPTGGVPNYPDDYAGTMPGVGPSPLMMRNQNFPNLAEALNAGRQAAYKRYPYAG